MHTHALTTACPGRSRLSLAASLAAILLALSAAAFTPSAAACTTGGVSCLPGSGYGVIDETWDCGSITTATCFFDSTTSSGSATVNHWGWGSAAYNGGDGDLLVCIQGSQYFFGCAINIARACFSLDCNDQDAVTFPLSVRNQSGSPSRVVFGHGKA